MPKYTTTSFEKSINFCRENLHNSRAQKINVFIEKFSQLTFNLQSRALELLQQKQLPSIETRFVSWIQNIRQQFVEVHDHNQKRDFIDKLQATMTKAAPAVQQNRSVLFDFEKNKALTTFNSNVRRALFPSQDPVDVSVLTSAPALHLKKI